MSNLRERNLYFCCVCDKSLTSELKCRRRNINFTTWRTSSFCTNEMICATQSFSLKCLLRPCVWKKISAFRLSRYFGFPGISKSETSPVYGSEFRKSENFAKLTENFPKNAYRKYLPKIYRNFRNMSKMLKIYRDFQKSISGPGMAPK